MLSERRNHLNIFITGGNGLLGSSFGTLNTDNKIYFGSRQDFDLSDKQAAANFFQENTFDVVIHCAANTNVEQCEVEPENCRNVNVRGTQNVLEACKEQKPLFIFISSTGNYGNYQDEPFKETDSCRPTTEHHKSKVDAEKLVQESGLEYLIIRTGWLFGGNKEHQKNFVYKRFLEASKKDELFSNPFQKGNPTWTQEVVQQIIKLINENKRGIYNCVSTGAASRLDYVEAIVKGFGLSCAVKSASKEHFNRKAPVSDNEVATNQKLKEEDVCVMSTWQDALEEYIKQLKTQVS